MDVPPIVEELATRLRALPWVTDLWVGGSLDLVALTTGRLDTDARSVVSALHRDLDLTLGAGADLGCAYVAGQGLSDPGARHPTWTHGGLIERSLSGIARAELVRHGFAVLGRPPADVLVAMDDDDVRRAARAELLGYWSTAVRHPWWWLDPSIADLGLTSSPRPQPSMRCGRPDGSSRTSVPDATDVRPARRGSARRGSPGTTHVVRRLPLVGLRSSRARRRR